MHYISGPSVCAVSCGNTASDRLPCPGWHAWPRGVGCSTGVRRWRAVGVAGVTYRPGGFCGGRHRSRSVRPTTAQGVTHGRRPLRGRPSRTCWRRMGRAPWSYSTCCASLQKVVPPTRSTHDGRPLFFAGIRSRTALCRRRSTSLVADDGRGWDAVPLVRYPDRKTFGRMVTGREYQKIAHLRPAALNEAVLQPTRPWGSRRSPERVLRCGLDSRGFGGEHPRWRPVGLGPRWVSILSGVDGPARPEMLRSSRSSLVAPGRTGADRAGPSGRSVDEPDPQGPGSFSRPEGGRKVSES